MPMRAPRTRSSSAAGRPSSSWPRKRALPRERPLASSSPVTARNSWVLPAPDSPTIPRHSPAPTARFTASTAVTVPLGVSKVTPSPASSSSGTGTASVFTGIQRIAQRVAQHIQAHQQRDHEGGRHDEHPGRGLHLLSADVDQIAQTRLGLLHAEAKEAQEALEQDHLRDGESRVHEHRPEEIRQEVAYQNRGFGESERARRLDE